MKILVTGGTGSIGKYVINELKGSHEIRIFTRQKKKSEDDKIEYFTGDIAKLEDLREATKQIDAVIHLAGGHDKIPHMPETLELNAMGTFNVLEAAAGNRVKRVVSASSDSALGFIFRETYFSLDYFPVDEKHSLNPQEAYGLSKLVSEETCKCYTRRCGMETISLRFCWVWPTNHYRDHAKILDESIYRFPVPPGESLNARRLWAYVDVRDAAQACRLAAEKEGIKNETFFITAENTFSPEPTLELISKYYPEVKSISTDYLTNKHKSLYDISKAKRLLGYKPKYNWRDLV